MTESFFIFSKMVLSGVRAFFCFRFLRRFSDRGTETDGNGNASKEGASGIFGPAVFLCAAGLTGVFSALRMPEYYVFAGEAFLTALLAGEKQKNGLRRNLSFCVFYEIGFALWTFLAGAVPAVLSGSDAFLNRKSMLGQLALWLFYGGFSALSAWLLRNPEWTEKQTLRLASLPALAGFLAVTSLSEQKRIVFPDDDLDLWILMSVLLLTGILVSGLRRQYEMERELLRLQTQQRELLERDYRALNHSYSVNARLFHDFHNHMGMLRELLSHENYTEALAYLNELQGPIREITEICRTGDEAVDFLIRSKAAAAADKGIQFQAEVEFPRQTNLGSADLTAILGNLLDNALEAAEQVQDPGKRYVSLVIRRVNQMLVIKVQNGANQTHENGTGVLKTTKTDGGLHGWGLKSAAAAAQKYDGTVRTSWENGVFQAVAVLSFQGQKAADGGHSGTASFFRL